MAVSDAVVEGLSGAIGGMVALSVTYPLMTVSTLQAVRRKHQDSDDSDGALPARQSGAIAEFLQVLKHSGWTGLFRGIEPALLGTAVSQGVYFYFYSSLRQMAVRLQQSRAPHRALIAAGSALQKAQISIASSLVIAALAGCGNVLVTNPIWVVATRMQANQRSLTGSDEDAKGGSPVRVVREVYTEYGWKGFWKGVVPSLVMVSNPTMQYVLYEWLMARRSTALAAKSRGLVPRPSALEVFGVSAVSKLGATLLTYPLLLVKTRMQSAKKCAAAGDNYRGTLDAIAKIYRNEGFLGFYSGMQTKMVQSVAAAALLFMIKEELTAATARVLKNRAHLVKALV